MGSAASSNNCETMHHERTSESNAQSEQTCDNSQKNTCSESKNRKLRTESTQNECPSRFSDEETDYDSADSDDTITLAVRMVALMHKANKDKHCDLLDEGYRNDVNEDDFIEQIALENNATSMEDNPYEKDTIGYYIMKANQNTSELNQNSKNERKEQDPEEKANMTEQSTESAHKHAAIEKDQVEHKPLRQEDRFEIFKKVYSKKLPRGKRPFLANKQTLVLAKVGSQYKYVAIPAYLPGQKLIKTSAIENKGFIERAEYITKVKPLKKRKYSCVFFSRNLFR